MVHEKLFNRLLCVIACFVILPLGRAQDMAQPNGPPPHSSQEPQNHDQDKPALGAWDPRDWKTGLLGAYTGNKLELEPLTGQQRLDIYLQDTLTTPGAYLKRAFGAVIDQARGVPSQWAGGWEGYGERFASREGQFVTANTLAALGNARLGYEVRYDECRCSGFWPRARHAIGRNFYTYNRTERKKRPQWALYGGALGGGFVSAAWKPGNNVLREGGFGLAGQAGWGALLNLFFEFAPDIKRKIGAKKSGAD